MPIENPPSTGSTVPVTNPARSEAKKDTAAATSSGVPARPTGVAWIQVPYAKQERWLEVPADRADQPYANGLRYYEHRWIQKYLREKMKKAVNSANLLFAKIELAKSVIKAHQAHGTIKTGRPTQLTNSPGSTEREGSMISWRRLVPRMTRSAARASAAT